MTLGRFGFAPAGSIALCLALLSCGVHRRLAAHPGCVGLECRQARDCPAGAHTTIVGAVYDPAGDLPLFGARVFVPNAALSPFPPGVTCEPCGGVVSGDPLVKALTGSDGRFRLVDVPDGDDVPLVVQIGRWRRQVRIPNVERCTTTLAEPDLTRLPRNRAEGELPQMAIATGWVDPFECLLRKIGISDSEFTRPYVSGAVHFYVSNGLDMNPPAPAASELWSSAATLAKYNIVILPCEGSELLKPPQATQAVIDFTSAGGRVFTTHYGYTWLAKAQAPFPATGAWLNHPDPPDPLIASVDRTFPKGQAFAEWLEQAGATAAFGSLLLHESRHNLDGVAVPSQPWLLAADASGPSVQHMTFNTPFDPGHPETPVCGRVVYSDFHVSVGALQAGDGFPSSCRTEALTAQERALAFMLFDVSACVQGDGDPLIF